MAGSDVQRLVLQVDAQVEVARQGLANLLRSLTDTADKGDASLKKLDAAHKRTEQGMGSMRNGMMELQHTFRAFGDSVAAGADPVRAFVLELGRVGEAAVIMGQGGAMGKFGGFLQGPWGLAVTGGIGLLAMLAGSHRDAGEASKDHESIENLLVRAIKGEEDATKKLTAAIREKTKAAREAIETDRERARGEFHQSQSDLEQAKGARPRLLQEKTQAALALSNARSDPKMADEAGAGNQQAGIQMLAQRATEAARRFDENERRIQDLRQQAESQQITLLKMESAAHVEESKAITRRSDAAEHDALVIRDREMTAAGENQAKQQAANTRYVAALDRVAEQRKKEEKQLADRNKTEHTHLRGTDMSTADATKLIRDAGGTVTSGDRSYAKQKQLYDAWVAQGRPADNPVAPPGSSAHNGAHGKHALDISGMTAKDIDDAFTEAGVHLTKILKERGHIHVEWGKGGPSAETMARRADAASKREAGEDRAYDVELAGANQRLARSRVALADTAEARYKIEVDEIEAARAARDREIDEARRAGKYGVPESEIAKLKAEQLQGLTDENAVLDKRLAKQRLDVQIIDRQYEHDRTLLAGMLVLLSLQEQLATTTKERHRIALEQLAYQEREARSAKQREIDQEKAKANPDGRRIADLQGDMDRIGPEYAARRTLADRQAESPLQRYKRDLDTRLGDTKTTLEEIEVQGLKGLEDDLASAASKALGLKGALGGVLDALIRIGLEKGLQALFGLIPGFGGGSGAGSLIKDFNGGVGIFSGLGFAAGGEPPLGKASLVGERGPELFVPKQPGIIIPNHALRGGGGGGGGPGGGEMIVHIDLNDEMFTARVEHVSGRQIATAAPGIAAGAAKGIMKTLTRPRL